MLTITVEPAPTNTMPSLTPIATSPVTTIATGGPDKGKSVEDARAMKGRPADSVLDPATLEQRSKGRVRKAMSRKNNPIRGMYTCCAYIAITTVTNVQRREVGRGDDPGQEGC